jgi:hypothetical protein
MSEMVERIAKALGQPRTFKVGNLFGEAPLDVPYAGCSHFDCIDGCNLGKGHCQRLEDAFKSAGYAAEMIPKQGELK